MTELLSGILGTDAARILAPVWLVAYGTQIAGFAISAPLQSEKPASLVSPSEPTYPPNTFPITPPPPPRYHTRQIIATTLQTVWSLRLAVYLGLRVMRKGGDSRFEKVKRSPGMFLIFWLGQALWIFLIPLGVYGVNAVPPELHPPIGLTDLFGVALWFFGITFEAIADMQKGAFSKDPKNHGKFIRNGLWRISRHPNYFGEIVLWAGMTLLCTPALVKISQSYPERIKPAVAYSTVVSPVFTTYLLNMVSGINILEKQGDRRWGHLKEWQEYKETTPALVPWIGWWWMNKMKKDVKAAHGKSK
ncbi:10911_t:CDS:2 [Paraglomus occultum]|uniref:10911_t:CDS:1 n=1 Tax=Paraglomus occultum TaxID=144539 RepID=A0A9N9CQC0_9GLOM|nr:10911_t:CDS:2 [Paraglomus occultum]